ncbi:cell division protein FtsQ/DivIB [Vagococcus hydrophili]|uniref:Cell division protein DivIB n=1 Tax=Vagococcus hydrophili TaxID=2714947 RepID=A0A6G8ARA0_9ENTE|nr:cell division protein FtsQ/DivIB [Vagococcus hydrophili]QIL47526.1 FtsQ-type POTRA domain-containing protein [Vagococcus hydrophili]
MTDNNNHEENIKKQLMLPNQEDKKESSENETASQSEQKQSDEKNVTSEEKSAGLSFSKLRYSQSPKEKELFKRLSLILGILVISIFITLYFISPLSKVGKIVVSGVENSDLNEVVQSSEIKVGKSLWEQYFNKSVMAQNVKKDNKRIETAKISLVNLNQLKITIKEYPTIGYVKTSGKNYEVLSNGTILKEPVKDMKKNLPLLQNFKEGENLNEFLDAYNRFDATLKENIESIESLATKTNPFRIKFKMKDGNEVIGLSTTIADKMAFYDKITAEMKDKGVIDMEAGLSGVFSYPHKTSESTVESSSSQVVE